jgi:hypothetical protein
MVINCDEINIDGSATIILELTILWFCEESVEIKNLLTVYF